MRKIAAMLSLVVGLAGCAGEAEEAPEEGPDPIELRKDIDPGPSPWDSPTGQLSKSIHYAPFNTPEGTAYVGGAIVLDKIIAHDAADVFSVNARVRNTTGRTISGSYVIEFLTPGQERILGQKRGPQPFSVEPYGLATLSNSALVQGAAGYKLYIDSQSPGAAPTGQPQPAPKPDEAAPKPEEPKPEEKPAEPKPEEPKPEEPKPEEPKPEEPPKPPEPEPPKE
jgi:hypothetical protein